MMVIAAPTSLSAAYVGLDVAKLTLQADLVGKPLAIANTPAGHRSLLAHLRRLQARTGRPAHVVCEGTGGYERAVVAALQEAQVAVSVHNAARVRAFARAQGRLAKTDALDAAVLSDFGRTMQPASDEPPTESEAALAALVIRRDQLKELVALEARRDEHHLHPGVKKEALLLQKQLAAHLDKIEAQINDLLAAAAEVKTRIERMTRVAGVGSVSAYTLLAYLPELGKLSRGAIAALAGVAPMNADSGPVRGQRHIRGGRAPARKALYMAALCSTLHNPLIRAYYKGLRAKGKPAKVALTAVMRKLLLHLNSTLKNPLQTTN
jgi:transposase